jgi:hypothetical protein
MKLPEEYWAHVERDLHLAVNESPRRFLRAFRKDIEHVSDLFREEQPDRLLVWRGQADADYGLSSSLFRMARQIYSMSDLSEKCIFQLEDEIIGYARRMGLGRGMTNVQLLHALQHYQIPTRLIDVSRHPIPALWFAGNDRPRKDGRLFLFGVPSQSERLDDPNLQMVPWAGIKLSNWTNQVLLLNAPASNPRMAAQEGAFLVGGLARNYAGQQRLAKDKHGQWRSVPVEQIHEISELYVKFPQQLTRAKMRKWINRETYGVTWRIPSVMKPHIRRALQILDVSGKTMYPDFERVRVGLDAALGLTCHEI